LLDAPGVERRTRLRHVVAGGEALTPELRDRFPERFSAALHNLYGPSETAISVTFWDCPQPPPPGPVPIGRPMSDIRAHVLDRRLELVPLGVEGELTIAGVAVGRGYLGDPGLTAERFVPDPLTRTPGGRLYRTGDRARRRGDGSVEFLGRLDHQVKLRGLRLEPGEIETVLAGHPALTAAAVVSRTATGGEAQLVAFVAMQEGVAVSAAELRAHLARQLPEAMVPRTYVALAALPLTPNGKVDRRALVTLEGRSLDSEDRRAPRTPVEELLAGIWSEVLRLPRPHDIDAEADFF
ncbi:MAG: amino acid adenylation domain-containing protein, partial [bacterium]|nr:amino acid adenylation domain-containing protein [bacterium]